MSEIAWYWGILISIGIGVAAATFIQMLEGLVSHLSVKRFPARDEPTIQRGSAAKRVEELVTVALEHELGIAGHEEGCRVCQAVKRMEEGRCHLWVDGHLLKMVGCSHDPIHDPRD